MRSALLSSLVAVVGVMTAVVAACSDSEPRNCRVNADCASGVCAANGACIDRPDSGTSSDAMAPGDDDTEVDAGHAPDDGGGLVTPGCIANKDGTITRDEVPIQAGLHGIFRFAQNIELSTAGTVQPDGTRKWDYSTEYPGDSNVLIETQAIPGKWYENSFKGATYATQLGKSPDLLAVFNYDATGGALALLGVASSVGGTYRSELTNTPPVSVLKFPLKKGKKWSTATHVTGVAPYPGAATSPSGPYDYKDLYENEVDAEGQLVSPLGTFDVLRVKIVLTRTFPAPPVDGGVETIVTTRQFAFVTECYGNVASISSSLNEASEEFTHAAELRRIAP